LSPSTRAGRVRGRPRPRRPIRIPAITGAKASESWRCPAVVTREIGRHRVSAARWILLVSPPRDRPRDSRLGRATDFLSFRPAPCVQLQGRDDLRGDIGGQLVARTGSVLVGAYDSGVDPDRPVPALVQVGVAA
jgi:hypothetical protein